MSCTELVKLIEDVYAALLHAHDRQSRRARQLIVERVGIEAVNTVRERLGMRLLADGAGTRSNIKEWR